ncbi:dynein axonemal intermediate chain 7 isoform 1-T1 [Callospermophilus lateralis]|uniref:dynein axonemal intermediate chain 7 isoform X1 n=1 Tax=Callospermophilus lateralis TaxID=76772 RepID=UPI004038F710
MGPKEKKSGHKKKKISKAERLKQLQEEEEKKRLKEEEEARLKREKEEQEKLEKQRIENEKWHQLEEKDLQRRTEELAELNLLEGCFLEAEKLKRDTRSLAHWKHYIQCDGSPDPSIAQEINTFISLWKEETNQTFMEVVEKSKLVLRLIEKLKLILMETPPFDLQEQNVIQYQGSILQLQELLHLKFNKATEILLRQASTLADLDSGNMEKVIQDENVTLYVWANLKKNPRYKSIKFAGTQIGFEIPKILATSDIALRLLHTHYDHVSPLKLVRTEQENNFLMTETVTDEGTKTTEVKTTEVMTIEVKTIEEPVSQEDQEECKPQESGSLINSEDEIKVEDQDVTEAQRTSDKKDSEAEKGELEMRLLSESISAAQLYLIENTTEKPFIYEDNEVDLCQFTTLGGVYHLDILELPPQYKPVKGWMIVQILQEGLQKFTYPPETMEDFDTENAFPPIEVTLKVHENVIFFEDPKVVRWDAEGKRWRTDGISNVSYDAEARLISFNLETFGPVTLIQDSHVNMPFLSWELKPLEINNILLIVTTLFTEIQIQIKENLCMLISIKIKDKEHVSNLEGKWMSPISFIFALKEAGLNIFPSGHSHFYVVTNNKNPSVEMRAYRQMALLSSAFAFGWSKWNIVCNTTKVIFKAREQPTEELIENPKWVLLMFSGDRAQRLKMDENSDSYSEALKEGTEFHSTLYHMLKDVASREAMEKINNSNCLFIDSVCHMLLSIRFLSYS